LSTVTDFDNADKSFHCQMSRSSVAFRQTGPLKMTDLKLTDHIRQFIDTNFKKLVTITNYTTSIYIISWKR